MEKAKLDCILLSKLNYALCANGVPVLRALTVRSCADTTLRDLTLTVTSSPEFLLEAKLHIDSLEPGGVLDASALKLSPSPSFLFSLTEAVEGLVRFALTDAAGELIAVLDRPLMLLTRDEWPGSAAAPELLAAFVTPNHPVVADICRRASVLLQNWTGSPAFTGYQSGSSNTVRLQLAAVFSAIRAQRIAYCTPPASFEETGQRIRLCDTILSTGFATCLDFSLLAASCLEFAGLHPLITVFRGHAALGVWLTDDSFAQSVQDDVSLMTKRLTDGLAEIAAVEATCMADGVSGTFEDAVKAGARRLEQGDFLYLVDICRARAGGIRPLPLQAEEEASVSSADEPVPPPEALRELPREPVSDGPQALTKVQLWERRLLDLSLRNSLLNFRGTKTSLPLLTASAARLEDALSGGTEFSLSPRPDEMPPDVGQRPLTAEEAGLLDAEFAAGRLRSPLPPADTQSRTLALYRAARTGLEENGANTLFFALGFLRWHETDAPSAPERRAPILLLPAEILRKPGGLFRVRLRDEEPTVNITLLELLRADFDIPVDGLDPVPTDEHGADLARIFAVLRRAVMNKKRWDVEETAALGIFSFSQFIMWNDLRRRTDELRENPIVRSLEAGHLTWKPETAFDSPAVLDDTLSPSDMAVVMSADSSQLAAVAAAGRGESFVLHGPPGTGKSQTITNMIANALYQGKTVLFVAEKQAALSVVQRRLNAVGLGPFCLPLHSKKAKKRDVLDSLNEALSAAHRQPPAAYAATAEKLRAQREARNAVMRSLHRVRGCGLSLYDAIVLQEQYRESPDVLRFSGSAVGTLSADGLTRWKELAAEVPAADELAGGLAGHPLSAFSRAVWSPQLRSDTERTLEACADSLDALVTQGRTLCVGLGLPDCADFSYLQFEALAALMRILETADPMPSGLVLNRDLALLQRRFLPAAVAGRRRDAVRAELLSRFSEAALTFDAAEAQKALREADGSWFLKKALSRSRVVKSVRALARDPAAVASEADADAALQTILEFQARDAEVKTAASVFEPLFGLYWNGGNPDWDALERLFDQAGSLSDTLTALCPDPADRSRALAVLEQSVLADPQGFCRRNGGYPAAFARYGENEAALQALVGVDAELLRTGMPWAQDVRESLTRWAEGLDTLRGWCAWLTLRQSMRDAGLGTLADALEEGRLSPAEASGALMRGVSESLASEILSHEPALSGFAGLIFEQKLERYRETAAEFERLTREELIARLSARIPDAGEDAAESSEIAILRRAIRSGGRAMSIRRLFSQLPHLLPRLAPCMLMSPLSAAQYIDPSFPKFDLVIFDEASQMPTCEAVGAIARGSSLVVVGDPRQLPPTSFFAVNHIDEDNIDLEDLESVLDDSMALGLPETALLWHYRSRHESLIAFSNRRFYENRLYTFPSPNDLESRVTHVAVEGFYDRADTRQNRAEAEAVVAEVVRRLRDPVLSQQSIGVVTFSLPQQNLVEDLLYAAFAADPALEEQNSRSAEPVFVKNLENVQGDERDVILFSVGYGPDQKGQVTLNFGPLNRDGGWRRLNVAVSRARSEMVVFSVLRPEQLDPSRIHAEGVLALRAFLEFAMYGTEALQPARERPDALAAAIADAVGTLGFETRTNIGASAFRIDIGVVHPAKPDTYLLGILLDNPRTMDSTARDRDIVQEGVLASLGWHILHVWTLDWWENPERELERIRDTLRQLLTAPEPSPAAPGGDAAPAEPVKLASLPSQSEPVPAPAAETAPEPAPEPVPETRAARPAPPKASRTHEVYRMAALEPVREGYGDPQALIQPQNAALIRAQIARVMEVEAPIEYNQLRRRVLDAWGISRSGARIERCFDDQMAQAGYPVTYAGSRIFCWLPGQDSETYDRFRVPQRLRRALEDIPPQEIAAAARDILSRQLSMTLVDLERSVSALFGYSRLSAASSLLEGIRIAEVRGWLYIDGDRVSVGNLNNL